MSGLDDFVFGLMRKRRNGLVGERGRCAVEFALERAGRRGGWLLRAGPPPSVDEVGRDLGLVTVSHGVSLQGCRRLCSLLFDLDWWWVLRVDVGRLRR